MDYSPIVASAAQKYGVPQDVAFRLVGAESAGDPSAVSSKGALGLTQLMPGTASDMGVTNPMDPAQNINGGMRYLGGLIHKYGDVPTALVAYNWGPGNVDRHGADAAPPETKAYVSKVTGANMQNQDPFLKMLQGAQGAQAPSDTSDPYMQMLSGAGKATAASAPAPQSSMVGDFTSAFAHNAIKPFHAAAQFVENSVAKGADWLDPPQTTLGTLITGDKKRSRWNQAIQDVVNRDNLAQQQWEQQYQQGTPDNAASYTGATVGAVAPAFFGGIPRALQATGDAVASALPKWLPSFVPKIVSGATQGGVAATTMSPVDNGQPYWEQKKTQAGVGTLIGGGIPAAGSLISGARNAIAPITSPASVVRSGLTNWGVTPESLSNAPELVPGSMPTTAQVVGNPNIVAAEKALANNPAYKPQFEARNIANNDARLAAVQGIAQSPQALDAAVAARRAATAPLQDALLNNGQPVPVSGILTQLDTLAKSPLGQRPAIGSAAQDIASQIRQSATTDAQGNVTISPAHLDVIRQNVKDFLGKYAPNGVVGTQQEAAFEPVRSAIVDAIEGANPGYRNYLAKYAQLSTPINTMEAGQSILDNLGNRAANASGAPQLTLTGVNAQVKKELNTKYGVSPEAQSTLTNLQADLQRASISNSLRSPGSDTAYNLQAPGWLGRTLYGQNFEGGKLLPITGGLLGGGIGLHTGGLYGLGTGAAAGAVAGKKLSDFASKRVNKVLADALLNPEVARTILASQPKSSPLVQGLLSRVPQASLMMGDSVLNAPPRVGLFATH